MLTREAGSLGFEIDGTFHRSQDLINASTSADSLIELLGSESVPQGRARIYIGKSAFDSLLEATFKESGKIELSQNPIVISVEDLEDMAEGYSNAFDEDSDVKINAQVDRVFATQFDNDFNNIPLKAELTIKFTNPIDERFLSAQAKVYLKGTTEVSGLLGFNFAFNLHQEKVKVMKFSPYFNSETTVSEFEEEYLSVL